MKKWLSLFFILTALAYFAPTTAANNLQNKDSFYTNASFSDVPKSTKEEYYAIQWAAHNGIVSMSNKNFNPNGKLTEAQFLKMYTVYFGVMPKGFSPNPAPKDWTAPYYDVAKKYKIPVAGYSNTKARNASISRGTVAQTLAYALGKSTEINSATKYLMDNGISNAQSPNEKTPAAQFGINNGLTRKQAALFLYRMYNKNITALNISSPYSKLTRTDFFLGGTTTVKVVNPNYKSLELQFIANNKVYGGYLTQNGKTFEGYTIGSTLTGSKNVIVNGKKLTLFVDNFNNNKIDAIYWLEDTTFAANAITALNSDFSEKKLADWEALMVAVTNVFRAKHSLPALQYDTKVASVAKKHSQYMLRTGDFAHVTKAGQDLTDRLNSLKLSYAFGGENLAKGSETVFNAHNSFMNSALHRPNILDFEFEMAGIGVAMNARDKYYTINFITYY